MTAPMTPPDCDLRDFQFMPLDVVRFAQSDLVSLEDPAAVLANIMLWCASWHSLPAASLTNDDRVLARLAGYGRGVDQWLAIKAGALRGWVECSDGRLYHPVVAEKALDAWDGKLRQRHRTFCAAVRKQNERNPDAKVLVLSFEDWNAHGRPATVTRDTGGMSHETNHDVTRDEQERSHSCHADKVVMSHPNAPNEDVMSRSSHAENRSKGEGQGQGQGQGDSNIPFSEENGRAATIPDPAKIMFDAGIALLTSAGTPERQARNWLGRARQKHGAETVIAAIGKAKREGAIEPIGFMEGCFKSRTRQGAGHEIPFV